MSPTPSYGLEVQDITVQPLYPVLDDNGECPGFSQPLHLIPSARGQADHLSYSANPCTVDMTQPNITFKLHFGEDNVEGRFLRVKGHLQHSTKSESVEVTGPGPLEPPRLSRGSNSITIPLQPFHGQHSDKLPWGIRGIITWSFLITENPNSAPNEPSDDCIVEHPLEIYAVTPFMDSYKTRPAHLHGMPRKALEFYLIHAMADVPISMGDYIRNIVNAVHADTGYVYDVWSGGPCFSASGTGPGFDFDIGNWARNLRPGLCINAAKMLRQHPSVPREFVGHYVNCYDQAAAVWTGVILALNSLEDANKLIWRFALPFGYIKPTRLVGWYHPHNLTNNPFFKGIWGRQHDETSLRTSFGNHAFLEFDQGVLDATCGPHTGNETLEEYFGASIDYPAAKGHGDWVVSLSNPWATKEDQRQVTRHGGITAAYLLRNNAPKEFKDANALGPKGETYSGEVGVKDFSYFFDIVWDTHIASSIRERLGIPEPEEDGSRWAFPIDALQSLGGILAGHLCGEAAANHTSVPGFTISRLVPDWVHLSWVAVSPSQGKRVAVDLFVLPNITRAADLFATRVWPRFDRPECGYEVKHDSDGATHAAVKGQGHGSILRTTRNVVYTIQGLDSNGALDPYERAVRGLFKPPNTESEAEANRNPLGDISIEVAHGSTVAEIEGSDKPEVHCNLGESVWVTFDVANAKLFSCNLANKWVLIPSKTILKGGVATYGFTTRNKGNDPIQFVICGTMLDISGLKSTTLNIRVT